MPRHKHADVIHAWAEGEEIEIFYNGQWIDAKTPNFCAMYEYRIKPKTVKREGWVNLYKYAGDYSVAGVHATEEDAVRSSGAGHITCIRVEWEEEV